MRGLVTGGVLAATLAVPVCAQAHDGGSIQHRNHYLRAKVIKIAGSSRAPGCDLVAGRCRGIKHPSRRKINEYFQTLRRMAAPPPPPPPRVVQTAPATYSSQAPVASSAPVAQTSAVPSGGCGDLPGYIVQRESGGNPSAVGGGGQYVGCAQVDVRHFGSWGDCAGLSYTACVNKLWDGGRGSSHWAATR